MGQWPLHGREEVIVKRTAAIKQQSTRIIASLTFYVKAINSGSSCTQFTREIHRRLYCGFIAAITPTSYMGNLTKVSADSSSIDPPPTTPPRPQSPPRYTVTHTCMHILSYPPYTYTHAHAPLNGA